MVLKPGMSALVTGGASGIGRALSLDLAQKGLFVTIVDCSEEKGKEVASLIEKQNAKLHAKLKVPSAMFIQCDVTNTRDVSSAFERHLEKYGGLDICINSAGIGSLPPFDKDESDGSSTWRRIINVNLTAVIDCTRIAIQAMRAAKKPGIIINLGSASGLYPLPDYPVYSGSKGGVVLFTRSLTPLKREGIRVNVLCPEFVDTELAAKCDPALIDMVGGFVPMEMMVKGMHELINDENKAGACLWITNRRGLEYWPTLMEERKYLVKSKGSSTYTAPTIEIPQTYKKVVVHAPSHNFRAATKIIPLQLNLPVKPQYALVKVIYAGVNASDVNFSSGRYFSNNSEDAALRLPFDAGFEAVGLIAAVGESVHLNVGTPVAVLTFGSYAEFTMVPAKHLLPVPRPDPEVVAMLTSGLTASIALEKTGHMESGQTVLVTAAAGGTGQFAVQLAKLAGNTVVATCGGEKKATLLRSFGVDHIIDYRKEEIKHVLKKEYPKGVDIIYESVGGDMFDLCLNALAIHGRLIVIGMISQGGFFLLHYGHLWQQHLDTLFDLFSTGKLKVAVDPKKFLGVGSVADAVEYLHSGESIGKVVVCIDPSFSQQVSRL